MVVDTHSFIWFLARSSDLSSVARQAIREAISSGQPVYVSSVTIVEVIYLTEKNRLPRQNLIDLKATLHRSDSGFKVAPFDLAIAEQLESISRDQIPDMPDRMIAATAQYLGLPLVTTDYRIQQSDVETIW
ncbi:MAG: type II toxin-antitoxin system VapC family toxin [Gemmatimonadota bacterium]|nr:type II toxin-antitoxin system VapC family toxin [Gemmatimonadota bacterium]